MVPCTAAFPRNMINRRQNASFLYTCKFLLQTLVCTAVTSYTFHRILKSFIYHFKNIEYPHLAEIINRLVFGVDFLLSARAYISSFTVYSPVSLKCKEGNTRYKKKKQSTIFCQYSLYFSAPGLDQDCLLTSSLSLSLLFHF